MKKIICAVATVIVIFIGLTVVLQLVHINNGGDAYGGIIDPDFQITKASYVIDVAEDRSAHVNEAITVQFLRNGKIGIIRDLPTNSGEQYYDITMSGDEYYVKDEGDFISIYTGNDYDPKYNRGDSVTYVFDYTIVPPTKTIGNTNYYMNAVPFGWATSQSDVSLTMTFPYEIKDEEIFMGSYGTTSKLDKSNYSVVGGKLFLTVDHLGAFNGVTVDVETGRKFNVNFSLPGLLAILVSIAVIGVAVCIKLFVVKDRMTVPVLNANPPFDEGNEIDPAEMGYLIDNNCEPKDITALIFYFASKGLLSIVKEGGSEFTLVKEKDIDLTAPLHQKIIFNGLFSGRNKVTTDQLKNTFYTKIAAASTEIKNKYSGKLKERSARAKSIATAVVGTIVVFALVALMVLRINYTMIVRGGLMKFLALAIAVVLGYCFGKNISDNKHKKSLNKIIAKCCFAAAVAMIAAFVAAFFILGGVFPFYGTVTLLVGLATLGFVSGLIGRKTEYYATVMNEISGFKQFLETAEKEKLEAMLEDSPQYYYDILPYANVLGVSEIWEDKFKDLENVPPPTYYYGGPDLFDFILINSMFRSSFNTFTNAMISRPSSSSYSGGGGHFGGGGGFGGGFGGGGFGGGGGRSR